MRRKRNIVRRATWLIGITTLVSACGGGSGGGAPEGERRPVPATPPPAVSDLSLEPTAIKTFRFRWTDVPGETEYRLLENPDGSSGYAEVASVAADETSLDLEVFLPGRINASYLLQACDTGGCSDSAAVFVSGALAEAVGYLKASNAEEEDRFGASIGLSADGNTLAVGAILEASGATGIGGDEADNDAANSGAVYVFTRSDGAWSQQAYVKASNTGGGDGFGRSVALSADGDTLAVGARSEDSGATGIDGNETDDGASNSGAVYVFTRSAGAWSQQAYVKASNAEEIDEFGSALALSADGDTLAVGAPRESSSATGIGGDEADNGAWFSGAVYVFTRSGSSWSQQAYVKASNTQESDQFGEGVALSADGDTLAVAARLEDSSATGIGGDQADDGALGSGAVYVFTRSGAAWSQQAYVKASNTGRGDRFGSSMGLTADGNTLAVGATSEASSATGIGGDQGDEGAEDSGAVYVFSRSGGAWSQQAYVKASNTGEGDLFGRSLSLSADGSTLAVGALSEDSSATGIGGDEADNGASESGAVYLFRRSGGTWSQQAYVKASNTDETDVFGDAVALSASGDTLAVAAEGEDSSATGIGGEQADNGASSSGAVYLY